MTGHGRRRAKGDAGFTLLEILVAVAIAGFLVAAVYGILVETLTISRQTGEGRELDREGQAILDLVCDDLAGLPKYLMDAKTERFSARKEGEMSRLDFVSSRDSITTASRVASDLTEVGYRLKPREDSSGLFELYRREDFFVDAKPLEGGTLTLLSDRVKSWSLEYRGARPTDGWGDSFSNLGSGVPPAAVRIRLILAHPKSTDPETLEEKSFQTVIETHY